MKYNELQKYFFNQSARLFSKLRVFSNVLYCVILYYFLIDCKAGTTAEGQNLLANISTSRASLLQGQYLIKEN